MSYGYERRLRVAQNQLAEAVDQKSEYWQDDHQNVTEAVRRTAELLGEAPGTINGYLEVWLRVCAVVAAEKKAERCAQLGNES